MKKSFYSLVPVAIASIALVNSTMAQQPVETGAPEVIIHKTNPHHGGAGSALTVGSTSPTSTILYHGGAVISTPTVYVIWYGNWNQGNGTDTPEGQSIVRDFLNAIGGSPYFAINTTYNSSSANITGSVAYGGEAFDAGSQGTRLSDSKILTIVRNAIANGLGSRSDAVYFVLTSSDVNETSGFCTRYCGWHTHGNVSGADIKYSFVGNAARCLRACAMQSTSPNNNPGVDGMISVIAHELEEATTDPDLNAWYDGGGAENADKCAWTFGTAQYQVGNGSWANMHLGSRDYLIQRNLLRTFDSSGKESDYCATAYDAVNNTYAP